MGISVVNLVVHRCVNTDVVVFGGTEFVNPEILK